MIRPIDIRLNAAHPELPLAEAVTFTGSPSTVLIRGVPPNCGRWAITAVFVAASFPDGSTTTRAAVQSANGVWVATLPATATSGRTANGVRVMADGIDENGEAVTGYILGVADFAVASLDVTPAPEPGETSYQMLYFDEVPSTLRKGDVTKIDGVLKFYNGSTWEPFAAPVTFDDAVTPTSANGVKSSGIWSAIWGALSSLPTGFTSLYDWCVSQLAGKLSTSGGTVTGDISMVSGMLDAGDVQTRSMFDFLQPFQPIKSLDAPENSGKALTDADLKDSSSALGAALAGKADNSDVVHKTGDETIAGDKTFTGSNTVIPFITAGNGTIQIGLSGRISQAAAGGLLDDTFVPNYGEVKSAIPYTLVTKTISNNAVILDDRAHNVATVAAPGSGNTTTITATLPPIVAGKSRDMFLSLTVGTQASDAGDISLSIVEPSGATVQIDIGSVEDISIGKNEILISENALPTTSGNVTTTHWLVTVRHEDFAS